MRGARAPPSLVSAAFSLAAVIGVPLGLWFAAHYSWRAPFLALAGVEPRGVVSSRGASCRRSTRTFDGGERRRPLAQLRAVFGVPNHLRAFAFMIALMTSVFMVVPFIAAYNVANVGVHGDRASVHLFRGRARDAVHRAAHRLARRPLRQEARVHDPRVRLARAASS